MTDMTRFVFLVFGFLALAFYEFSGGTDFSPTASRLSAMEARQSGSVPAAAPQSRASENRETVARANLSLVSFDDVVADSRAPRPADLSKADPAPIPRTVVAAALSTAPAENAVVSLEEATLLTAVDGQAAPVTAEALANPSTLPEPAAAASPVATGPAGIRFEGTTLRASSAAVTGSADRRYVSGDLVNLRSGPGTAYGVVGQLSRGTEVEVLGDNGGGWVRLRALDGGAAGWIADFLLSSG